MKRFFTLIAVISMTLVAMAQHPMVTLSHNGELKFFSTLSALSDAVAAASDGDVLYLSEGQFTALADTIKINKRLSIQGCGYGSRIMSHVLIDLRSASGEEMDLPIFDGVSLPTLVFVADNSNRSMTENAVIRKCYIENMYNAGYAAKNLTVDRCWVKYLEALGASESNVVIRNSKIQGFPTINDDRGKATCDLTLINCNVKSLYFLPKVVVSSILGGSVSYVANGRTELYNTVTYLGLPSKVISDGCYVNVSIPWGDDCDVNESNLVAYEWYGQDGTVVGIHGGETPFSENPSVPVVESSKSSVEYDAENNKLKVSISVKAD